MGNDAADSTTRPLAVQVGVTLDGFVHGAAGHADWGPPPEEDDVVSWRVASLREAATHVMGRVSYEVMSSVWPTSSGVYAGIMNDVPKVVLSRTLTRADWPESRMASRALADEVAELKRGSGGVAMVHGGMALIGSLVREALVDEYRLLIHPVVIGHGISLFAGLAAPLRLDVVEHHSFSSGTMVHVCLPRRDQEGEVR